MTARSPARRRRLALVALAALVVLAGCNASVLSGDEGRIAPPTDHASGDPGSDVVGWEGGYWYDDDIAVTPDDGYNESERAALVNRTMARIEQIRGLEFDQSVPVDVITRAQYRANRSSGGGNATYEAWNDQVWEGLFIIPEDAGSSDTFDETLGESVLGYYSPGDESIVIVSDSPTPQISNATLAHELVHALQDQQFGLGGYPDTQDRQLASDSVVEGEANFVESVYTDRCGDVWACLPQPESGSNPGGSGAGSVNRGLLLTILTPYTAGQTFVESVYDDEGWSGVSDLHENDPESTEQVIHPDRYPAEKPLNVTVPDRSSAEWERFGHDPVADTVGEASIYAMFLDNDVISTEDVYSYESTPSEGWAGDALVPYTDGDGDEEDAYVWTTAWDSADDAREFASAYRDLLREHDARSEESNVFVVPEDDPYDDAFRVVRDGRRVRVVNAPTVDDLDAVHESP